MNNILIFDLYTRKSYDDVGGKKNITDMGIAIAGIFSYSRNELTFFEEENVNSLIQELTTAELIVGVNLKKFCYKVLATFTDNELANFQTLDILEHLKKNLSFIPTLEDLMSGTLGIKKEAKNELLVPRLVKQGRSEEIKEYCKHNILEIKDLYDFGRKKGYLFYTESTGQRWKISVNWK
jgi:DEAD/DEAH box helicase domain-containing protein